ncbi:MAG: flagellin [Kiritimatiellae bacterium]|nr:flagellin [Kiritimatiellia bacterium]MDD4734533.1 flagellin [Kiritimatiellia bacterium]
MQIYNNAAAFGVWKDFSGNVDKLRQSMSKLSSGLRIRNAGDDPAGLAMSERLRAQLRNSTAASSNVENKINYLLTADAWLQKVQDMMDRMSELAVSANDGTKTQIDRDNLQTEFREMQKEITRITTGATAAGKFNGIYLFRGGNGVTTPASEAVQSGNLSLQIGPDGNQTFTEESINLTATNFAVMGSYTQYSYGSINMTILGSGAGPQTVHWASLIGGAHLSISTQSVAQGAISRINIGIDYLSTKRSVLGSELRRMEMTLSGLSSYEENIRAAESRIRDTDVALELTKYTKYYVLTQVDTAMLAQANALPINVVDALW